MIQRCYSFYNKLKLNYLIFVFAIGLLFLTSCSSFNSKDRTHLNLDIGRITIDTLVYGEDFGKPGDVHIGFVETTFNDSYPFNSWIKWKTTWKGEFIALLAHCEVFMVSSDSNVQIRNINDTTFYVKVEDNYQGGRYMKDRNLLFIELAIRPHKGYLFEAYWLDSPISYPESTCLMGLVREMKWKEL